MKISKNYNLNNQKNYKNKFIKKNLFFLFTLIYTLIIILIFSDKETIFKKIRNFIPLPTRQLIKESFPYQLLKSNFKVNFLYNIQKGFNEKVSPIRLDIKFKDIEKLNKKRKNALSKGVLIKSNDDYVSAVISDKDKSVKAKIRLKGDWTDHLQNNKLSYRVKIEESKSFMGMKKFSLQSPVTRNYFWEWVYHELLRNEGLPALRYKFRPLIINGDYKGIYALEEHFDKTMLEANNFKESPIIKLREESFFENRSRNLSIKDDFKKSYSTTFQINKLRNSKIQMAYLSSANQLLNSFKNDKLSTSNTFEVNFLSDFFAINDLLNAHHSTAWHNMRFYFDPLLSKLIPIGFDGEPNKEKITELIIEKRRVDWVNLFFNDIDFTKAYIRSLDKVSKIDYFKNFYNTNKDEYEKNKNILFKSYPALSLDMNNIFSNQELIKAKLKPTFPLNIFLQKIDEKKLTFKIANNQYLPIEIIYISSGQNKINLDKDLSLFKGIDINKKLSYKEISLPIDKDFKEEFYNSKNIQVAYKIYGLDEIYFTKINNFPHYDFKEKNNLLVLQEKDINNYDFFDIDQENRKVSFNKKTIVIDEPLFIPENYTLEASPGTEIEFKNDSHIVSKSPLIFIGSKNDPIIIKSNNKKSNGSIAVLNTPKKSILSNVEFYNLSNIATDYFNAPGSITFYQAPVLITNCNFKNIKSEDSLNIVRTKFEIRNSEFQDSLSDAIDIDFSSGNLVNLKIQNSLNDGLDLSGSEVLASNLKIFNSGDKAISLGENSIFNGVNININNAFIAVANKDGSKSKIDKIEISNSKFNFAVFNKKTEYNPPKLTIKNFNFPYSDQDYLLSEKSKLFINQSDLKSNASNEYINKIIYGK